jgi:hypothetical protein
MRKSLTALAAALTFGGAVAAAAAPADARPYGGHYGHYNYGHSHHRNNDAGVAIAAGVVGLALGAALAGNSGHSYYNSGYYNGGYYNNGYYNNGYGYPAYGGYGYGGYGYRTCESRRWVYDPYIGRRVMTESRYAC